MKGTGESVNGASLNEYQDDIENMDTTEDRAFWKKESTPRLGIGPPAGRSMWHLCTVLSVSAILLFALIITVAVSNVKVDGKFKALEKTVANLSTSVTSINSKMQTGKETTDNVHIQINMLKDSLKITERQLDTVTRELRTMDAMENLKNEVSQIKCALEKLTKNVTSADCCPMGWTYYSSSCFYFSDEGMSWDSAREYCTRNSATLVILKNEEKWNWVAKKTKPNFYWIGLTDERTGNWEWVDGTPYYMNRRQWKPGQPDDWTLHGLGGGEDCAHLHNDGRLNDDHCSRDYRFVCEASVMSQESEPSK
ncbi:hypothetical protein AGOR_G00075750 [Albula goreensis]|uniref:C-type lectin domain-containing protein n=1 Tax=Albula goreensis TaxID=1534307 RepID=A0A8T3DS76_9TELE|nr:hypothetical protein AGOR_G00075750 [Albula goreensis]